MSHTRHHHRHHSHKISDILTAHKKHKIYVDAGMQLTMMKPSIDNRDDEKSFFQPAKEKFLSDCTFEARLISEHFIMCALFKNIKNGTVIKLLSENHDF